MGCGVLYMEIKIKIKYFSQEIDMEKPLYYYINDSLFIASSEIKSIFHYLGNKIREINPGYLARFLVSKLNDYASKTFTKKYKVLKGEILEFDNLTFQIKSSNVKKFPIKNFDLKSRIEIKDSLKLDLQNAVSSRLISDAPVGVLVSGGIDSSAIVSNILELNKKDNVDFFFARQFISSKNQTSEDEHYVKIISKSLKIKINQIDLINESSKIENIFFKLKKQFEEPFNIELASVPTFLISEAMKAKGIKVSIDGVAGDEILSGYPSFLSLAKANINKDNYLKFF